MNRIITISINFLLCIFINAQEKGYVGITYSEISVECAIRGGDGRKPFCTIIQSNDEFFKFCRNSKITINIAGRPLERPIKYSNEVILHVFHRSNFKYDAWYDEDTNIIHFFVYYRTIFMTDYRMRRPGVQPPPAQIWFAIKKPKNGYQVHFHLIDVNNQEEVIIFESIK